MKDFSEKIEQRLYFKGFRLPDIRSILRIQIQLCGIAIIAAFITVWFSKWPITFAIGAVIATFSFFSVAKFVQQIILREYDRSMLWGMLFRFYGRLLIVGVAVAMLIVKFHVPMMALVSGLATSMVTMLIWMISRQNGRKTKEA
ncbi:ATP synthase subunit I [Halodesulfovibrio sp.]|uniref:ATP synthase subunit I n=1 Tax=Halodesulfovibrio sp. TaxID=1912772 RepID=UPI0025B961EA|nr:ATP synthase subunit I [Halodesulfovibrio sp.]